MSPNSMELSFLGTDVLFGVYLLGVASRGAEVSPGTVLRPSQNLGQLVRAPEKLEEQGRARYLGASCFGTGSFHSMVTVLRGVSMLQAWGKKAGGQKELPCFCPYPSSSEAWNMA